MQLYNPVHKMTNNLGSGLWTRSHELDKFQSPRLVLLPTSKLSDTANQGQEAATPYPPIISTQIHFVIGLPNKMGKRKEKEKWGKRMEITQYL